MSRMKKARCIVKVEEIEYKYYSAADEKLHTDVFQVVEGITPDFLLTDGITIVSKSVMNAYFLKLEMACNLFYDLCTGNQAMEGTNAKVLGE